MATDRDAPLAAFEGARPSAPTWYAAARKMPMERLQADVDGAAIEVLAWGERGRPGILLVHGARAHAHWWLAVAPLLARDYRVAALSLSGMGGSDHRAAYDLQTEVAELLAAVEVAGLSAGGRPVLVGHSFGANCVAIAAREHGGALAGAILVDTGIGATLPDMSSIPPPRIRPDLAAILARFRLAPPETSDLVALLDDVARAGVVEHDDGWHWRFDPHFWDKLDFTSGWTAMAEPRCPIAIVFGEQSAITPPAVLDRQRDQAPRDTPFVPIPHAGHHVMLQQPIALTVAIRALVEGWRAGATSAGATAIR